MYKIRQSGEKRAASLEGREGGRWLEERRALKHLARVESQSQGCAIPFPSPGGGTPLTACLKDVSFIFLNQDRKFLCRHTSQLGNSFYVLFNSFCCSRSLV